MTKWFLLRSGLVAPPDDVADIADAIGRVSPLLRSTEDSTGGLKRSLLQQVVAATLGDSAPPVGASTSSFEPGELDFVLRDRGVAISVQAGRAWINNGALVAVLAAAADSHVDWLINVVPRTYKKSDQYSRLERQLADFLAADGVMLGLKGVALIAY